MRREKIVGYMFYMQPKPIQFETLKNLEHVENGSFNPICMIFSNSVRIVWLLTHS
jgi:hypothetical protein